MGKPLSHEIRDAYNAILPHLADGLQVPRTVLDNILIVLAHWRLRAEAMEAEIDGVHALIDEEERRREAALQAGGNVVRFQRTRHQAGGGL